MSTEYCIITSEKVATHTDNNVINLVLQTLEMEKQVLIFNNSKRSSEATAEKVANAIKKPERVEELQELSKKILGALGSPTSQCKRLAKIALSGVAFHHSGLVSKQRSLIEESFKSGLIKVISSTPTLAAGLNLPAYKVIIKDYKRYSARGMADIPILEYHQMAGRAGRPGHEDVGRSVLCVGTEDEASHVVPKYVFGDSEEIISKLAIEPTLKMYILSLIAMDMINTKEEIKQFFASTLYAHQYQDLEALNYNVFRIIEILKDYDFVIQDDDYYMGTQLGKKVSELYLNPDTAHYFLENIAKFVKVFENPNATKYDEYSLINFVCNTAEMRPLFRVLKSEEDTYVSKLEEVGDALVVKFDPFDTDYETFMNSLKTTDILFDWIAEAPEDYISDKYRVTPGELNYKVEVVDWLLYCLEEIAYIKKQVYFKTFLTKFRMRFKFGIKRELLPLVGLKGIGRVRARKLFNAGFRKILDLKKANFQSIARVIGDATTVKVKEQISEQADILDKPLEDAISQYSKPIHPGPLGQPQEVRVEEVSDAEVDVLVSNYEEFEKEKKEKNMTLTDYF